MDQEKICIEQNCQQIFFIEEREAAWYKQRGFEIPKRCATCRAKKKAEKERQKNPHGYGN